MKCRVCGKEFELSVTKHYISRDEEVERCGIASIVGNNTEKEVKLYDTFDCPICGCQNVVQERKRSFVEKNDFAIIEEDEEEVITPLEKLKDWSKPELKELPSCFGSFDKCEYPYCANLHECKENNRYKDSAYPSCIAKYNKYSNVCKECEYLDECVARSEANEVCND